MYFTNYSSLNSKNSAYSEHFLCFPGEEVTVGMLVRVKCVRKSNRTWEKICDLQPPCPAPAGLWTPDPRIWASNPPAWRAYSGPGGSAGALATDWTVYSSSYVVVEDHLLFIVNDLYVSLSLILNFWPTEPQRWTDTVFGFRNTHIHTQPLQLQCVYGHILLMLWGHKSPSLWGQKSPQCDSLNVHH